jgi:hypothetical protein
MSPLTARCIEHSRADWKAKDVDHSRRFGAISLGREDRRVFEQILRVEIALPPLRLASQKNTGSR